MATMIKEDVGDDKSCRGVFRIIATIDKGEHHDGGCVETCTGDSI